MHPYVHCSTIHCGQDMETIEVSFYRRLDGGDTVHIYSRTWISCKKDEIVPFVTTGMDLENTMLNKMSQTGKDKNYMVSLM